MKWGTSKSFSFDYNDILAVVKNALLVGAAAAVTFLAESIAKIDMGASNVFISPVVAVALNSLSRWLKDYTKTAK
jgi:hypothetical protein